MEDKPLISVNIERALCKQCGFCVAFCPRKVLAMRDNYPTVVDIESCTACLLCDMLCPDFAVTVVDRREPKKKKGPAPAEDPGAERSAGGGEG